VAGISPPAEIEHKTTELSAADMVILGVDSVPRGWFPAIDRSLDDFAPFYKGSHIKVMLRKGLVGGEQTRLISTRPGSSLAELPVQKMNQSLARFGSDAMHLSPRI